MKNFYSMYSKGKSPGMKILFTMLLFLIANIAVAQVPVTGFITDAKTGESMPGANIYIKGSTIGTQSDLDGKFSIQASQGDILVISYVGYLPQEILVTGETNIEIALINEYSDLDEVIIVGYGSQKKSVVTGAISSIKAKDLEALPILRVDEALQGRTSGVTVAANSGQPGSSSTVRVRGITSLNDGANDPLWIVDGVVIDNGGIGYLNQADIESIEVLKDAASQAIYGARAAAGVILITTKKGQTTHSY